MLLRYGKYYFGASQSPEQVWSWLTLTGNCSFAASEAHTDRPLQAKNFRLLPFDACKRPRRNLAIEFSFRDRFENGSNIGVFKNAYLIPKLFSFTIQQLVN